MHIYSQFSKILYYHKPKQVIFSKPEHANFLKNKFIYR